MRSISREDYGYYEAPRDWEDVRERRERKELHDEEEHEEKKLREEIKKSAE
ncbi:MAG TPA: hypothetical protein PLY95_03535 [Candidatus Paceibacterota bacterium]|nr:hypothetical protein [Candidatus Paceibacterota bacterium]